MAAAPPISTDTPSRAVVRRRKVTDTARKLFVEQGFHATGMAQIAKESGVAVGQIYRDFASKDDIVAALVTADCGRLMMYETLETAIRDGDADSARAWLHAFVEPSDEPDDARLFAEILAETSRSERIAAIVRSLQDDLRRHILAALRLFAPAEALAARRTVVAEVVITLSFGMFHQQLMRPDADLGGAVRGVQAVVDRELAGLADALRDQG